MEEPKKKKKVMTWQELVAQICNEVEGSPLIENKFLAAEIADELREKFGKK